MFMSVFLRVCVTRSDVDWSELIQSVSAFCPEMNVVFLCPAAGADREMYYAAFEEGP